MEKEKEHPNTEVVVITHGGAIGDFLLNTFKNLKLVNSPTGASYVEIIECSITTIVLASNKFILQIVGDVSHLPELLL